MTCNDCRYCAADGTCRRYPPSGRPTCWPTVHAMDWCGEFQAIPAPPPPPPPPMMEQLEEGVPPKVRFQKARTNGTLKEIQESPLFQS